MSWLTWAQAAGALVVGLAAGFVVTVLIARIPAGEGLRPPLRCPHCGAGLRAADLIPVLSWPRLRGRCRECQEGYGAWYPAAELITAGLFLALWLRFGPVPLLAALAYFAILSVALTFIDARSQRLPDALTLPAYPISLVLLAISVPFVHDGLRHLVQALIGMAVAWLFFFIQALIYPSGIGWGDVKLSGILGLFLGWFGVQALVYGIVGGYLLAAVAGLGLIVARRATRKTKLAFGPFLLIATMAVIIATGTGGPLLL
jgi:leader peptidase (prepilin peptidase) / N-methyltransferase